MSGPLAGIRVLEFESIGPAPFAGMLLADMGADVLVIDRPATTDLGLEARALVRRHDARQALGDSRSQEESIDPGRARADRHVQMH